MKGQLEGRVAIITGGASGIGKATAQLFVASGARVIIADLQESAGATLVDQLGSQARFLQGDVSREVDVRELIAYSESEFGRLDCLFNNAGVPNPAAPIESVTADEFDRVVSILLRGVFLGIKYAAPIMKRQRSGSILSTASVAGLQAGFAGHAYSAAKAAVIHLTRSAAMELGEHGIRVNCICPGGIATPIFSKSLGLPDAIAAGALDALTSVLATSQPIPRAGLPEDVAQAALWLAADESSFVNGHTLVVDGGLTGGRLWSPSMEQRERLRTAILGAAS